MSAVIAAATNTGVARPKWASSPPAAGPTSMPTPPTAPRSPNCLARSSGALMSARYAMHTGMSPAVVPSMMRDTTSTHRPPPTPKST